MEEQLIKKMPIVNAAPDTTPEEIEQAVKVFDRAIKEGRFNLIDGWPRTPQSMFKMEE